MAKCVRTAGRRSSRNDVGLLEIQKLSESASKTPYAMPAERRAQHHGEPATTTAQRHGSGACRAQARNPRGQRSCDLPAADSDAPRTARTLQKNRGNDQQIDRTDGAASPPQRRPRARLRNRRGMKPNAAAMLAREKVGHEGQNTDTANRLTR